MNYWDNVDKKIANYCKTKLNKINKKNMIIGNGVWNLKCHLNSVQYAIINKADVYSCITLQNDCNPIFHFINKKDNKFIDNTVGWQYKLLDYYLIEKINTSRYNNISRILEYEQNKFKRRFVNPIFRFIFHKIHVV